MIENKLKGYLENHSKLVKEYDDKLGFEFKVKNENLANKLMLKIDGMEIKHPFCITFNSCGDMLEIITTEASEYSINIHKFNKFMILEV